MKLDKKDIVIILTVVVISIILRIPISNIMSIDTTQLSDPDSYFYARRALEFSKEPISNWSIITSRIDDPVMNSASLGIIENTTNFLPIIAAFFNRIFSFISINTIVYYFCTLLCPITGIVVYIFIKRHFDRVAAIFAAFSTSISFPYFAHSRAGFFDTDAIIMLLSISLVLSFVSLLIEKKKRHQAILVILIIILALLFSLAWNEYYFYIAVLIVVFSVLLFLKIFNRIEINTAAPIVVLSLLAVYILLTIGGQIVDTVKSFFTPQSQSAWPPASLFISELSDAVLASGGINCTFSCTRNGIINWLGGLPLFLVSIVAVAWLLTTSIKYIKYHKEHGQTYDNKMVITIALLTWLIVTLPLLIKGIRFVQLIALPINILVGIFISQIYDKLYNQELPAYVISFVKMIVVLLIFGAVSRISIYAAFFVSVLLVIVVFTVKVDKLSVLLPCLIFSIFLCPIISEYVTSNGTGPLVSNDLASAVDYVDDNTDQDSVITCWWNYGYYYQYELNRQVVADGGTYNGKCFYWLGKMLITDDEKLSAGICRMFSSGSLEAVDVAVEYFGNEKSATQVMDKILTLSKKDAKKILENEYNLSKDKADNLLNYSHPSNERDNYLIISKDDMEIISSIAYFATWDFDEKSGKKFLTEVDSEGTYILPKELEKSTLTRLYSKQDIDAFELFYSNGTALVYKVNSNE